MEGFQSVQIPTTAESTYSITGADCQILTVSLKANDKLVSEPGSLMFMSTNVKVDSECGSCFRTLVGESCCRNVYHNKGSGEGYVAVTPSYPAKVVPVNLATVGQKLIAKGGSYMSSIGDVHVTAEFDCCPTTCCFGGLGVARQLITGSGTVFLEAGGVVLCKILKDAETLVVDTDAIVAFEHTVKFNVRLGSSVMVCCFAGEGCFNSTLTGPGLVILQSMSFNKFKAAVAPANNQADSTAEPPNSN